ncbi:hypothetical protein MCOR27_007264 [Pyricularia oryzae]|nr:hypothetical protein MCOR27_007264 [Pyricularia oryzae]KAI6334957.1 hypothetical protein MCOR30_003979 [Pyricularia oryzae]KAI6359977.1 hypothetical protein MCOR31_009264 [Pyricularia oryzae]KAI6458463.1 hypothetical protein MCOR17_007364 [Pyricularia oryzae]
MLFYDLAGLRGFSQNPCDATSSVWPLDLACEPEYAESKETLGPMTIGGCQSKEYDIVFLEMGTNRYTGLDFIEYELNIVKP